jgi:hypothetical protein
MATTTSNGKDSHLQLSQPDGIDTYTQTPGKPPQNGTTPQNGATPAPVDENVVPAGKLGRKARVLASLTLLIWLNLFAGGIFIDTKPSRCVISSDGVAALARQGNGNSAGEANPCPVTDTQGQKIDRPPLAVAWVVAVVFFLPLNLALLCATAGVLGTFGNLANLYHDQMTLTSQDNTNPYISGLLRGFFVYLFVISGMLVLDEAPFSNSSPAQYYRLAGFLSLLSFIVNYQPQIFSKLVDMAQNRIPNTKDATVMTAQDRDGKNEATVVAERGDTKITMHGDELKVTNSSDGLKGLKVETQEDK